MREYGILYSGYFSRLVGVLKLLSVIFGFINFGFMIEIVDSEWTASVFFMGIVTICVVYRFIFLFLFVIGQLVINQLMKEIDIIYHAFSGILLAGGSVMFFLSAKDRYDNFEDLDYWFDFKVLICPAMALLNGITCEIIAIKICNTSLEAVASNDDSETQTGTTSTKI